MVKNGVLMTFLCQLLALVSGGGTFSLVLNLSVDWDLGVSAKSPMHEPLLFCINRGGGIQYRSLGDPVIEKEKCI